MTVRLHWGLPESWTVQSRLTGQESLSTPSTHQLLLAVERLESEYKRALKLLERARVSPSLHPWVEEAKLKSEHSIRPLFARLKMELLFVQESVSEAVLRLIEYFVAEFQTFSSRLESLTDSADRIAPEVLDSLLDSPWDLKLMLEEIVRQPEACDPVQSGIGPVVSITVNLDPTSDTWLAA